MSVKEPQLEQAVTVTDGGLLLLDLTNIAQDTEGDRRQNHNQEGSDSNLQK